MRGLWIALLLVASLARADPIDLKLVNGLTVRAEFRAGATNKPAVMILHGFLQTYDSPTVQRLIESLNGEGYTVLAPNLSLNLTNRRQSLACEAIHTHTMQDDTLEIEAWISWLMRKQPNRIVLIGHSFGSVNALAYLSAHPNAPIDKYIFISVMEARSNLEEPERVALLKDLQGQIRAGDKQIIVKPLSYCQKFLATPASLASYLEWSPDRILSAAQHLSLPGLFIMGGRDDRMSAGWIEKLGKSRFQVKVIAGANHFMDAEHEFDLHDMVLGALREHM